MGTWVEKPRRFAAVAPVGMITALSLLAISVTSSKAEGYRMPPSMCPSALPIFIVSIPFGAALPTSLKTSPPALRATIPTVPASMHVKAELSAGCCKGVVKVVVGTHNGLWYKNSPNRYVRFGDSANMPGPWHLMLQKLLEISCRLEVVGGVLAAKALLGDYNQDDKQGYEQADTLEPVHTRKGALL